MPDPVIANTFVIGAMKCATTGLCDLLSQHPDAFLCRPKEPDFFSRDEEYAKGLQWYAGLFGSAGECRVRCDGSTSYTKGLEYPRAAERLARLVPDARLIYMVRDPFERIGSHWAHEVLKGRTRLEMEAFVRSHPEAIDISCYWRQIQRYRDHFPDDRICVLFFEDYRQSVQAIVDRYCAFLDIPRFSIDGLNMDRNETSSRRRDIAPIRMLRRYRWFDVQIERSRQVIPPTIRRRLKQYLKSGTVVRPAAWTPELRGWVGDQLADDNQRFLATYGKPADFWSPDSSSDRVATVV